MAIIDEVKSIDDKQRVLVADDGSWEALVAPLFPLPDAAPPGPYTSYRVSSQPAGEEEKNKIVRRYLYN